MADPNKKADLSDPALMAELGCITMSSEALSKMSLNPYDQLFICRLMNLRDEAAKDEMFAAIAEVVAAQNRMMFDGLGEQTALIKGMAIDIAHIKTALSGHEDRLKNAEDEIYHIKRRVRAIERKVNLISRENGNVQTS
ncbi:MAG TPA: hypothetical protein PLH00_05375 [Bacteroidaceae bacterium]|jgi:hypothetical protein|nr:hypothetical protein [Bacteroidaceae bacterium]